MASEGSGPSPPPEGGLLTAVLSITSPSVIEDINLFLHPVSSMLSRPVPAAEAYVCRPLITPVPMPVPTPEGLRAHLEEAAHHLGRVDPQPVKQGQGFL